MIEQEEFFIKYKVCPFEDLDNEIKNLFEHAKSASESAYAPYSNFKVGSAALLSSGQIVRGSNQENAAYPSGLCAERTCLFTCGATHPQIDIKVLVVIARLPSGDFRPVTPCGACRQVMIESEQRQKTKMKVVLQIQDHQYAILESASSLLPFQFDKNQLV